MRTSLLIAVFVVVAMLTPRDGLGCTCGFEDQDESYADAAIVFSGRVIAVESAPDCNPGTELYTFEVYDCWKGISSSTVTILAGGDEAECGVSFAVGEEMILYAGYACLSFGAGYCSRRRAVGDANERALLGDNVCLVSIEPSTWGRTKASYGQVPN